MKAILISVRPEWADKILRGVKTIELRKTFPKCELPIDVYIYVTKDKQYKLWQKKECNEYFEYYSLEHWSDDDILLNGKVVAKFKLNAIGNIMVLEDGTKDNDFIVPFWFNSKKVCITLDQINKYRGQHINLYAWHIEDLEKFNKPKNLSDFKKPCIDKYEYCYGCKHVFISHDEEDFYITKQTGDSFDFETTCMNYLRKAPQSWCYIEVE